MTMDVYPDPTGADHDNLVNLDKDGHPQYLQKAGGTMTGALNFNLQPLVKPQTRNVVQDGVHVPGAGGSYAMNLATANVFHLGVSSNLSLTVSNATTGADTSETITVFLHHTVSSECTITWPAGTVWQTERLDVLHTGPTGSWDYTEVVTLQRNPFSDVWYATRHSRRPAHTPKLESVIGGDGLSIGILPNFSPLQESGYVQPLPTTSTQGWNVDFYGHIANNSGSIRYYDVGVSELYLTVGDMRYRTPAGIPRLLVGANSTGWLHVALTFVKKGTDAMIGFNATMTSESPGTAYTTSVYSERFTSTDVNFNFALGIWSDNVYSSHGYHPGMTTVSQIRAV